LGAATGLISPPRSTFTDAHPDSVADPPLAAQPGAVGEPGYSPLVQVLFRGRPVVLNAPQIENATGLADKIASISRDHRAVAYLETDGCYDNESVHYASFNASDPGAATIEDVTHAPALAVAPSPSCADAAIVGANCSRESLIEFTNGETGAANPERESLNAALLDGPPPLNILQEIPEQRDRRQTALSSASTSTSAAD
jgi:hypothetical protein